MVSKLQQYFPMLKTRQALEQELNGISELYAVFSGWREDRQQEFLNFCTGAKGVKMLYDCFFKEILNPDTKPERMEWLLSLLLKQKVNILKTLPNESSRIADEGSLLIMDIIVELEDGSIVNVECQKVGYTFPGQRAACYSADLLMRQYRRIKKEKASSFSYKDIKNVYTIIFYEKSPAEFHAFPEYYIHHSKQTSDTGIKVDLLQEFLFIPLDIFFDYHHNKGIKNELEAWLTFLGTDEPEDIIALIEQYPQFEEMYRDVYMMCHNTEKVMSMFSEELKILDRNTVKLMIDEMQTEIDTKDTTIDTQKKLLKNKDAEIANKNSEIENKDAEIAALKEKLLEHGIN